MNTKLAIAFLAGVSVSLSISAYAIADGEPSDPVNWSYVMANDIIAETAPATKSAPVIEEKPAVAPAKETAETIAPVRIEERDEARETVVARTVPNETTQELTLTYVDEALPTIQAQPVPTSPAQPVQTAKIRPVPVQPIARAYKKNDNTCAPMPIEDLAPQTVARTSVLENKIDTRYIQQPVKVQYPITRQYPISVQYPVTIQREVTIEQPVIMQQPVIVRRPVVMQQAVTVQRQPAYIQQQPMVMQQQPTYIQQQPIVMQAPANTATVVPQQPAKMPTMTQQPVFVGQPQPNMQPQPNVQPQGQPRMNSVPTPVAPQGYPMTQPYMQAPTAQPVYTTVPAQPMGYGYSAY